MKKRGTAFLGSIVLGGILMMPLFTVSAIEYGGIGGRPANPDPTNPRTQSIFVYTLEPSVTREDGILVINNTRESKKLAIYATDSTPSTDGAFACKQKSEERLEVGSWITLSQDEITLDPVSSQVIPFTVNLPENASVGEHNGCILIQEIKEKVPGQAGATLSVRTGLRVAITVPGQIIKNLSITSFTVDKNENGNWILIPQVTNSGNASVDASVKVVTKNIFGKIFQEHGGLYPILRGQTSTWNFELQPSFWGGWYRTQLVTTYQDVENNEQILKSDRENFFIAPSSLALMIYIGILLMVISSVFYIVIKKQTLKKIYTTWDDYVIMQGDDLMSLANQCNVPWKKFARINRISPPYVLIPGQTIKIPPGSITQNNKSFSEEKPVVKKKVVRKKRMVQ